MTGDPMTLSTDQIEAERARFEAWARQRAYRLDWNAAKQGYHNGLADCAWQGWIAAKSSPVVVTPEMVERGALRLAQASPSAWKKWPSGLRAIKRNIVMDVLTAALNPGAE